MSTVYRYRRDSKQRLIGVTKIVRDEIVSLSGDKQPRIVRLNLDPQFN